MPITPPHPNRLDYWIDGSPAGKDHCKEWWRIHKKYSYDDTQNFTCIKCLDVYFDSSCPYKFRTKRVLCEKCLKETGLREIKKYNPSIILLKRYENCREQETLEET